MKMGFAFGSLLLLCAWQLEAQGTLTPPGPPAPSMKTLDQIEPRTPISSAPYIINTSGSYYLTTNLVCPAGTNAISVRTGDVRVDLNGYTISGSGAGSGIAVAIRVANVHIVNGTIRSFGDFGIDAGLVRGSGVRNVQLFNNNVAIQLGVGSGSILDSASLIEQCTAVSNRVGGIRTGRGCAIRSCAAIGNGNSGIESYEGCTVTDSSASYNTYGFTGQATTFHGCSAYKNSQGFVLGKTSKIANCTSTENSVIGISCNGEANISSCSASANGDCGIVVFNIGSPAACLISDCITSGNSNLGIWAQQRAMISRCTADNNRTDGLRLEDMASVIGCTVLANSANGINAASGCLIQECQANNNGGSGISANEMTRVIGCNALSNGGDGINVKQGSTVMGCTARNNGDDGIEVANHCVVSDNNSSANGTATPTGAGVHATQAGNRIEANQANLNDNGFRVDTANNIIIRNSTRANGTNFVIVGGNDIGPIGSAATSTSPFANIQF